MGAYTRHHFVPQFYLRNFAIDANVRQIGLFNLPNGKFVRATSIRDQAQRKKLYGEGGGEQALCDLEGASATVLRRMIERREVPEFGSDDHFTLLVYVLFQAYRTPTAAAELEEFNEQLVKKVASLDERYAPHIDKAGIEMPDAVHRSLQLAAESYPVALDLRYKLLVNKCETPFMTSDHPVVLYNQYIERRQKFGSSSGLACKGLQIFLPLSPEVYLVLFDSEVYRVGGQYWTDTQVATTQGDVESLNVLQTVNMGSQLFFGKSVTEQAIQSLVAKAQPLRLAARSSVTTYPPQYRPDGTSSVLLHSSKTDLRIGLKLFNVVELPSAQGYQLGDRVVHRRDQILCDLHDEFLSLVDQKAYHVSQFRRFMADKMREAGRI
ncbi:MAG: hypothetical protein JWM97_3135 [Phycisphaerales bacterium]|nr:hypothetical protein [Phycisphaerales bacterium]